jgi:hypothetical protein
MRPLRIIAGILGAAASAVGLLFMVNADRDVGGAFIISGAILLAGTLIAFAIAERK